MSCSARRSLGDAALGRSCIVEVPVRHAKTRSSYRILCIIEHSGGSGSRYRLNDEFCRTELGLDGALGALDESKLNIDGGAIALGHPVGASGTRIVLHALNVLKRTGGKRAIAAICIGGGQGGAMLVERT